MLKGSEKRVGHRKMKELKLFNKAWLGRNKVIRRPGKPLKKVKSPRLPGRKGSEQFDRRIILGKNGNPGEYKNSAECFNWVRKLMAFVNLRGM